jgi:NAD(P)-dependent dehydrogenase (short-subunit alcohol dehydrogenase family)
MATNHYGPFLLTHLLIDLLKRSAPSRIIVVSSFGHFFHWNQPIEPFPDKSNWTLPYSIYFQSKLSNIFFTQELARRIANTGVTVNCLNPGMLQTDIYKSVSPFPFNLFVNFTKMFYGTVEEGTHTILYLATSEEGGKVSGQYFSNCKIYKKTFSTPEKQKELFDISAKRMLKEGDTKI